VTATSTRDGTAQVTPADGAAAAIFETLRAWDIERVFICPGSTEAAFLDASLDRPGVQLVATSHEAVTVSMADGYARATGRPAVAYVHTHLGLSNGLAHLSCAHLERSPVVVLTGLKATSLHGAAAGFTTTSDVAALPLQFVKWAHETQAAEAVATDLDHALTVAATPPAGPVFLGIAQDRMEADAVVPLAPPGVPPGPVRPAPGAVRAAAELLAGARRPLVVAGAEVFRGDDRVAALEALAAALGAPVVVEDRRTIERAAPGGLDGYAGVLDPSSDAVRGADALLLAGARAPIRFEHAAPPVLPPGVPVVHVTEDARELARGPAGALPVLGDAYLALDDLATALDGHAPGTGHRERAVDAHRARVARLRHEADEAAGAVPITVPALMRRLCADLAPGTWIVDDSVTSQTALLDHALAHDAGLRYLTTAGGSLGWAMGAAPGVAEARPGDRVVAVVGDGVFQFGIPALWTAAERGLPVTFVVVNNRAYGAVRAALRRYDGEAVARGEYPAAGLAGPDLAAVARGFGVAGVRVERLAELPGALAAPGPAVVEVMTDPNDSGPLR
jgi:benzoylformate decarboxylase